MATTSKTTTKKTVGKTTLPTCHNCKKQVFRPWRMGDFGYCESCFFELFAECYGCGNYFARSEMVTTERPQMLCKSCVPKYTFTCHITKEKFVSTQPKKLYTGGYRRRSSRLYDKKLSPAGFDIARKDKKYKTCYRCKGIFLASKQIIVPDDYDEYGLNAKCPFCALGYMPFQFNSIGQLYGCGRTIGVEFECEPTPEAQMRAYSWRGDDGLHLVTGKRDGSLRGHYPAEFVSPILHESNYEDWVDKFCSIMDATVYNRCGLHIHLGTNDFSWHDINKLMRYCYMFQPVFASMVARSRRPTDTTDGSGRPMALPVAFATMYLNKNAMLHALYGPQEFRGGDGGQCALQTNFRANDQHGPRYPGCIHRYQWLNVHGHAYKRAIEVRLHHGTTNATKTQNWIALWLHVLNHVSTLPISKHKHPFDYIPEYLKCYYRKRIEKLAAMGTGGGRSTVYRRMNEFYGNVIRMQTGQ